MTLLHTLFLLVRRDLKVRIAGSYLGVLWYIAQPLFLILLYGFVFGAVLGVRFHRDQPSELFVLYLMAGMLPYIGLQESVLRASNALVDNRSLLSSSPLPIWLYPLVPVLSSAVTEFFALLILLVVAWWLLGSLSVWIMLIPLLLLARVLMSAGLAWSFAVLTPFLRDISQILTMLLTLLLFATPIFYPADMVPESWRWIFGFNPLYYLVSAYRGAILEGVFPAVALCVSLALGLVVSIVGFLLFRRLSLAVRDVL